MDRFLLHMQHNLHLLGDREVATALWALARLQVTPSQQWLTELIAHCQPRLSKYSSQDLSMTMWALAKMKAKAPDETMRVRMKCHMSI